MKVTVSECLRCGHQWVRRNLTGPMPKCCAKCKSPYWRTPPILPQRRPKKYPPLRPATD